MLAKNKRPESRTRIVRMDGREWRVQERAEMGDDQREVRSLVFSSDGETREVRNYHWLWFGFMDDELAALCRARRVVAEALMTA
jgi:hypothetical protein